MSVNDVAHAVERSGPPELAELPGGQIQVTGGFDCWELTKAAYVEAGSEIPRDGPDSLWCRAARVGGQPVIPKDLVFLGLRSEQRAHGARECDYPVPLRTTIGPQGPLSGLAATIGRALVAAVSRVDLLVLGRSRSACRA